MKYVLISAALYLATCVLSSQTKWNTIDLTPQGISSSSTQPLLILNNGLSPSAVLTNRKDIICVATDWIERFPLIAERADSSGNLRWNRVQLSYPQNPLDQNRGGIILPRPDGGAYFVFEFWEFKGRSGDALLYAKYPHIQLVDATGSVQWGVNGKRLTNMVVSYLGGSDDLLANYSPDGNIIIYWKWFDEDSLYNSRSGGYAQKVDAATGELLWGKTGKMLFDYYPWFATSNENGTTYIVHKDSVACFDSGGQLLWDYPLWTGITNQQEFTVGTNENGELLILYTTNEGIKGRMYGPDGQPQWIDKLVLPNVKRVPPSTKLINWGNTRWIFKMGAIGSSVFCVDRTGGACWGDSGVTVSNRVLAIMPIDDQNVLVAFQEPRAGEPFEYDLKVQKTDKTGRLGWGVKGIHIIDRVGSNCQILPDSSGGAYLIFDALTLYEPEYRPRGTYLQKVDKDGNVGIITAIQEEELSPNTLNRNSAVAYPNPFSGITTIRLISADRRWQTATQLTIYDILGREVRRYAIDDPLSRTVLIVWDGKDNRGIQVPPGVYFYRVATNEITVLSGKLLRIK